MSVKQEEVARFWVFAGQPLIVSIQHCQLRGDGRQNKIHFQILLFSLVLPTNHIFGEKKWCFILETKFCNAPRLWFSAYVHSLTHAEIAIEPTELLRHKARGGWVCTKSFSQTPVALKHL